jgi:hypothetical protein
LRKKPHRGWQADPQVWTKDWGVHIQPAGSGAAALKYLGAYVACSAISDGRIFAVDERGVTFRWKDRSHHNRSKVTTLTGSEFVRRYLPCFASRLALDSLLRLLPSGRQSQAPTHSDPYRNAILPKLQALPAYRSARRRALAALPKVR